MCRALRLAALTGCAAAVLGGGCGDDDGQIRSAIEDIRRAYLTERYREVCEHMTETARREVGKLGHRDPTSCPKDMAERMSATILSPRDRVEPRVREIAVDGDRARVTAVFGGTTTGIIYFAKEDGEWKLDQLWGTTGAPPPDL